MKKVVLRYMKNGAVEAQVPKELNAQEIGEYTQSILVSLSDRDIMDGLEDMPKGSESMFDGNDLIIEAVEDVNNDYKRLYQTPLWARCYSETSSILKRKVDAIDVDIKEILQGIGADLYNDGGEWLFKTSSLERTLNPDFDENFIDPFADKWTVFVNEVKFSGAEYLIIETSKKESLK